MCLLMVAKPNATPTDDDLLCACVNNPDGFGYAIHTGKDIITGRGMNPDDVIDRFLTLREKYINGYALFHARLTTHGTTDKSNCHPFRVGGRRDTILAHNGILSNVNIGKGDNRSDTRVFAEDILPSRLYALDHRKKFKKLSKWAGSSKIAILNNNPDLKKQLYIVNENLGTWSDGLWWSNSSYKDNYYASYYPRYDYKYGKTTYDYDKKYEVAIEDDVYLVDGKDMTEFVESGQMCGVCATWFSDPDYYHGYCQTCWACLECQAYEENCMCWRPEYKKNRWNEPLEPQEQMSF